jgi:hypothetical protein
MVLMLKAANWRKTPSSAANPERVSWISCSSSGGEGGERERGEDGSNEFVIGESGGQGTGKRRRDEGRGTT